MPNTAKGTPYVVSTDLVANYPTVSSDLADHIDDNLAYNAVTINAQTGTTYTFALADASEGKLVTASNAAASTYTVPPQSSVTWAAGAVLRILNQGAGTVTIAAGSGVTINGTPLTLAQYKGAAIQRTASNTWTFVPFSGGVGNANFSDAATGTYSSGGDNWKYITYTASGTLTVTEAGFADVLVVGGGGGGGEGYGGGGGAGAHLEISNVYLPAATHTVTVGAGGVSPASTAGNGQSGNNGTSSRLGFLLSPGGGGGGGDQTDQDYGKNGGSGGGASLDGVGGSGITDYGNNGGAGQRASGLSAGGGGGAGGAGAAATGSGTGGAGGAGKANSFTGSSVTRSGGGGGFGSTTNGAGGSGIGGNGGGNNPGSTNTGSGGGGGTATVGNKGGNGGSGVVIIRVRT